MPSAWGRLPQPRPHLSAARSSVRGSSSNRFWPRMRTPDFWSEQDYTARLARAVLSPVGWMYGASVAWKRDHAHPFRAKAKTVCVGNLTAGGSGKTPIVAAIVELISKRSLKPVILTRGYGGSDKGPLLVDPNVHRAEEIGDEPLRLAGSAPVIVSRNRAQGAMLADEHGADVIVMDDGHQNFQMAKDVSIVVVDAEAGFGNGRVLPAGPLREPVPQGLARADAVVLVGLGTPGMPSWSGPVIRALLVPDSNVELNGARVVAFAGIGRPEKFFGTLL